MNNFIKNILLFCLPISLLFSACQEKQAINYAIVSGTLSNSNGSDVVLVSNYTSISHDTVQAIKHVLKVDENGGFIDTVYINGSREFRINKERSSIEFVINRGQHLQLTADCKDFQNTSIFTGDYANENNYLLKKSLISDRINAASSGEMNDDEATFSEKEEGYYNEYMQLLDSFTGLKEDFISNEKKEINYSKVKSYIYYAMDYKRIHGEGESKLSSDFFDVISATNMQDYTEYKRSVGYQFLLRGYYNYKYVESVDNVWEADPVEQLKLIAEIVSDKNIQDELFIMFGKPGITSTPNLQGYYAFFMSKVENQTYRDVIIKKYKALLATQPGQISPEFNGYQNIDGGTNSLSDFSGKYVYIDIWATWCGPCRGEIPYLEKVEAKYHGNDKIVFISLSVDYPQNLKKWQDFVKEKKLGGIQLIADNAFDSEFIDKFQINGIPRFILIDQQGKIVRADAPRPSDEKLIELFTELGI